MAGIEDEFEPLAEPVAEAEAEAPEPDAVEAVTEEPAAEQEAEAEAPAEPEKPAENVPLSLYLETRNELKDIKRRLDEPKPVQREAQPLPDILESPDDFASSLTSSLMTQTQQAVQNAKWDVSEVMARENFGDEVVDKAFEAAKAADMVLKFAGDRHSYGAMVKWYQAEQARSEIGNPAEFMRKAEETARAKILAEMAAEGIKAPPSAAGETSIGGRSAKGIPTFTSLDDLLS